VTGDFDAFPAVSQKSGFDAFPEVNQSSPESGISIFLPNQGSGIGPEFDSAPVQANPSPSPDPIGKDTGTGIARAAIGQGLAAGFGDEIEAFARSRFNSTDYDTELANVRAEIEQFGEDHPIISGAAEIGGVIAGGILPVGAALQGASTIGRVARAGVAGAGFGAVEGFGSAEGGFENRAKSAGVGAVTGGVAGAVAPIAIAGAVGAGRLVKSGVNKVRGGVASAIDSKGEAAKRVAGAIDTDRQLGEGLAEADLLTAQASGAPVINLDQGGEQTRALARSAANLSSEARTALEVPVNERFAGQGGRITDQIRRVVGNTDATATREGLMSAARKANKPAYAKAYKEGSRGIVTPELERLMGSPEVARAMKRASERGKSRAIADGFGGFNNVVKVTDDGQISFRKGKNGVPTYPNLQFWDYVKRELDDMAGKEVRSGGEFGRTLTSLSSDLRKELDRVVPAYGDARAGAAKFFGAQDALEAGQKFVGTRMPIEEARRALGKMSAPEKKLFREGFAAEIVNRISRVNDRRDVINSMFNSKQSRAQVRLALGDDGARKLEAFLHVERIMDRARSAFGNSTTARQFVELGLAGSGAGYSALTGDVRGLAFTGMILGAGRVKSVVNRRMAKEIGILLASDDPKKVSTAVARIAKSKPLMEVFRKADIPAAFVGAEIAPNEL